VKAGVVAAAAAAEPAEPARVEAEAGAEAEAEAAWREVSAAARFLHFLSLRGGTVGSIGGDWPDGWAVGRTAVGGRGAVVVGGEPDAGWLVGGAGWQWVAVGGEKLRTVLSAGPHFAAFGQGDMRRGRHHTQPREGEKGSAWRQRYHIFV
jgi:hypothetical protein